MLKASTSRSLRNLYENWSERLTQDEREAADRLLLVDDNPTNLQVLLQALEEEGYELLVALSGEEALSVAKEGKPQLILLDINMPGIDGYETCRRLKADPETADAVVIFLSARGDVSDKVLGLEVGAVDYIGKPFQFEEVLARVQKHLAIYREQKKLEQQTRDLKAQLSGGFQELTEDELEQLLAQGEGEHVEFKSTLRWNLHTNKPDKRIENNCLKTVAAFLNSAGGVLLVGVDDDGNPVGCESDQFDNEDKLLLHWNGLIKTFVGVETMSSLRSMFREIGGKRVLVVQCLISSEPVFFRRDQEEMFFIRTGNGSQPLKPSEIVAYLGRRQAELAPVLPTASEGRRLGPYTVEKKLGAGGMGTVYLGQHAMLKRPTAIKMLDPNKTDEESLARFEREVQLTSQLNHPNTIAIYDYGRTLEGVFYYVMEYLDGLTLEELVNSSGPQPEGRVIGIVQQVAGSLAEAAAAGMIHRDVKPANIMVNHRGGIYDFVKLLDFGLIRAVNQDGEMALTATGVLAGTPLYMSPESITAPESVDGRGDLYSLGAVAYYLLTGRPPFSGKSVIDVCLRITKDPPPPPSQLRGEAISRDLEGLILQCLAKDPAERPQSPQELKRALLECSQAGSWTEEAAAEWWRQRRSEPTS